MVTIVGGKYTTYRIMARDAVDAAARPLGRSLPPTPTARPAARRSGRLARGGEPAAAVSPPSTGCPSRRCGGCCTATATSCPTCWRRSADDPALGVPIAGTAGYLPVEFLRAVTHEGAFTLDDVLTRRTHVAIEDPDAGAGAADEVAGSSPPRWAGTLRGRRRRSRPTTPNRAWPRWSDPTPNHKKAQEGRWAAMQLPDERAALVEYCLRMQADDLTVGTSGNLSVRSGDLIAITPSGVVYDDLTPGGDLRDRPGRQRRGSRPRPVLRGAHAHLGLPRHGRSARRAQPPDVLHHAVGHDGRGAAGALHDHAARRAGAGRALRPVRQPRAGPGQRRRDGRPHRCAAAQPRRHHLRRHAWPRPTRAPSTWNGCASSTTKPS